MSILVAIASGRPGLVAEDWQHIPGLRSLHVVTNPVTPGTGLRLPGNPLMLRRVWGALWL